MKKTGNVKQHQHCLHFPGPERSGGLTRDSKYVDRHGERLRPVNGLGSTRNKVWKIFSFYLTHSLAFEGGICDGRRKSVGQVFIRSD